MVDLIKPKIFSWYNFLFMLIKVTKTVDLSPNLTVRKKP